MNVDRCLWKLLGRLRERPSGGVGTGDPAQQGLERAGGGNALQIPNQRQAAVGQTAPAEAAAPSHGHLQLHAHGLTGESLQDATAPGMESEGAEAGLQAVGVLEDGWQDGEVGHRCHGHWGRP